MVGQWLGNISQSFCYLQNCSMLMFGHSVKILAKTTIINCTAQGWHGREILQAERDFQSKLSENSMKKGRLKKNLEEQESCSLSMQRQENRKAQRHSVARQVFVSFVVLSAPCHSVNRAVAASSAMVKPDLGSSLLTKQFASIIQVPDLG